MANDVEVIQNPFAPEFYVVGIPGYFVWQNNVTITFTAPRPQFSPTGNNIADVVAARIVLPLDSAKALIHGLTGFLKAQGVDTEIKKQETPPIPMPSPTTVQ